MALPLFEEAPKSSSRGYKRSINLRYGLNLLIRDYWLQDILVEENLPSASGLTLEFGFNLVDPDLSKERNSPISNSFLQLSDNPTCIDFQEWQTQGRLVKIDLHLETPKGSEFFNPEQLELIPAELQERLAKQQDDWYTPLGSIAPNIQLVLQQILNCPYAGSIQQVYLEGKALELIALQSARFLQSEQPSPRHLLKRSNA